MIISLRIPSCGTVVEKEEMDLRRERESGSDRRIKLAGFICDLR